MKLTVDTEEINSVNPTSEEQTEGSVLWYIPIATSDPTEYPEIHLPISITF